MNGSVIFKITFPDQYHCKLYCPSRKFSKQNNCLMSVSKFISFRICTLLSENEGAGIAQSGWTTRRGGSSSPGRIKNFRFSISSRPALRSTQPPIKWVPGALPGVTRQGREADHSPPTSAEVKKMWMYTSTPLYVFMA
jgi:hypothetical protein